MHTGTIVASLGTSPLEKKEGGGRSGRVSYTEPLWDTACMRIPSMLIEGDNEYLKEVGVRCDCKQRRAGAMP